MLPADVLAALTQSFHIGSHNVWFVLLTVIRDCAGVIVLGSDVLTSNVCPVQRSYWVLAIIQCFIQVIFFLLQQLLIGTDCPSPVFEGVNNTIFGRQMVVTVPLQTQICVWAFCILLLRGSCQAEENLLCPGKEGTHLVWHPQ